MGSKTRSAGRFGVRYGKTIRKKIITIEEKQRAKQRCPFCKKLTAKRMSMGIFRCKKCNTKFTAKAYTVE